MNILKFIDKMKSMQILGTKQYLVLSLSYVTVSIGLSIHPYYHTLCMT